MLAVDANVVVRYLVNDDAAEAARARRLVEREDVFVPVTVVLETEWVLRSVFGFSPAAVMRALRGFAGLRQTIVHTSSYHAGCFLDPSHTVDNFLQSLHE